MRRLLEKLFKGRPAAPSDRPATPTPATPADAPSPEEEELDQREKREVYYIAKRYFSRLFETPALSGSPGSSAAESEAFRNRLVEVYRNPATADRSGLNQIQGWSEKRIQLLFTTLREDIEHKLMERRNKPGFTAAAESLLGFLGKIGGNPEKVKSAIDFASEGLPENFADFLSEMKELKGRIQEINDMHFIAYMERRSYIEEAIMQGGAPLPAATRHDMIEGGYREIVDWPKQALERLLEELGEEVPRGT